jgi:hypothetical protein
VAERIPRVRRLPIPNDALLVVRGDDLDAEILRADARRFRRRFDAWDRFGVSALVATDEAEVLALCESRLERFPLVVVYRRPDLEVAGLEVVPTFRTPHVTLAHQDIEALVTVLLTCEHRVLDNPHFE